MPYLRVRIATLDNKVPASEIAQKLTSLTVSDLNKVTDVDAVDLQYVDPQTWFIGGKSLTELNETSFFIEIKITESTNSRDQKARYIKDVFNAMSKWFENISTASYVVLQDVAADSWGYGGKTQEYRYISQDNS
ncbi:tautomerase family protein [Lactiplantibacillus plantarum]|uniref:tautomerase family protein n=1 Tax=Lactiplantibacillus plantarum TaxID=1590 RepID=UPI000976A2BD|nr:tautomerase family protein [Lactiplantibacillus plantarum]